MFFGTVINDGLSAVGILGSETYEFDYTYNDDGVDLIIPIKPVPKRQMLIVDNGRNHDAGTDIKLVSGVLEPYGLNDKDEYISVIHKRSPEVISGGAGVTGDERCRGAFTIMQLAGAKAIHYVSVCLRNPSQALDVDVIAPHGISRFNYQQANPTNSYKNIDVPIPQINVNNVMVFPLGMALGKIGSGASGHVGIARCIKVKDSNTVSLEGKTYLSNTTDEHHFINFALVESYANSMEYFLIDGTPIDPTPPNNDPQNPPVDGEMANYLFNQPAGYENKVTLPINEDGEFEGSAHEIFSQGWDGKWNEGEPSLEDYESEWFTVFEDYYLFKCPSDGAKTATTSYPRSEPRNRFNYPAGSVMHAKARHALQSCGDGGKLTCFQIHRKGDPCFKGSYYKDDGNNLHKYRFLIKQDNNQSDIQWSLEEAGHLVYKSNGDEVLFRDLEFLDILEIEVKWHMEAETFAVWGHKEGGQRTFLALFEGIVDADEYAYWKPSGAYPTNTGDGQDFVEVRGYGFEDFRIGQPLTEAVIAPVDLFNGVTANEWDATQGQTQLVLASDNSNSGFDFVCTDSDGGTIITDDVFDFSVFSEGDEICIVADVTAVDGECFVELYNGNSELGTAKSILTPALVQHVYVMPAGDLSQIKPLIRMTGQGSVSIERLRAVKL